MKNFNELQSQVITFLRFPMIFLVVYIHGVGFSVFEHYQIAPPDDFNFMYNIVVDGVCRMAVPLFFLISGYLFFSKEWDMGIYLNKMKRRFHSLFIPYCLFIIIAMIVIGSLQYFLPEMLSGKYKPVYKYNWLDFLLAFWKMKGLEIPYVAPLWFVRNLMVTMIFSPLIYWGIKYISWLFILPFGMAWLCDISSFSIPGAMCLTFFSLGAWFRIKGRDLCCFVRPFATFSYVIYPVLLIVGALLVKGTLANTLIDNIAILVGIVAAINLSALGVEHRNWEMPAALTSATFFVYAAHVPYIGQFVKVIFLFLPKDMSAGMIDVVAWILFFTVPLIFMTILVTVYHILKKICPRFTSILVGERG